MAEEVNLNLVPGIVPDQAEEPKEAAVADPEVKEEKVEPEEKEQDKEDENKVPYSRFKKFHDEALELREKLAYLQGVVEGQRKEEEKPESDLPPFWVKLYGDSDASREAWNIQKEQNERLKAEAREEALKAVQEQREEAETALSKNLETIDSHLDAVAEVAGRELTEKEQSALLDAIDFLTPKGEDGNYAGPLVSPEAAWDYLQAKQNAKEAPKRTSRDSVAALSNANTQGETSVDAQAERNKNFNPRDWTSWMPK